MKKKNKNTCTYLNENKCKSSNVIEYRYLMIRQSYDCFDTSSMYKDINESLSVAGLWLEIYKITGPINILKVYYNENIFLEQFEAFDFIVA